MPKLDFDASNDRLFAELNSPASVEIKQLIAKLQHSHDLRYKMINLETWALAQTMDHFLPGFWSRFLANRRTSLQQFLKKKRTDNSPSATPASSSPSESEPTI
jgi:hypothetical protein